MTRLVVASLLTLLAAPALACSFVEPEPFVVDDTLEDAEAPAAPVILSMTVTRGAEATRPLGDEPAISCTDLGFIELELDGPSEEVGHRFTVIDGDAPDDLGLPGEPVVGLDFAFIWVDGATDDQEPLSLTIEVVAVDLAGNESAPTTFTVDDPGGSAGGCSTAPGSASAIGALAALALVARRRR